MRVTFPAILLFLSSLPTTYTLPPPSFPPSNTTLPILNLPSKPYQIHDCGSRTPAVSHALDSARSAVIPAIADAQHGTRSPYGFTAFFKTSSAAKPVVSILGSIRDFRSIRNRWPGRLRSSPPEFVCVHEMTGLLYPELGFDPWAACQPAGDWYGFWAQGSRYIFLCDAFFAFRVEPPSRTERPGGSCIGVRANTFAGFGNYLLLFQKYMLVHEMVHFYMGSKSLGRNTSPIEFYALNDCVRSDKELSMRNPQNYEAYVAMVEQRCTNAPDPFQPPFSLSTNTEVNTSSLTKNVTENKYLEWPDEAWNGTLSPDGNDEYAA